MPVSNSLGSLLMTVADSTSVGLATGPCAKEATTPSVCLNMELTLWLAFFSRASICQLDCQVPHPTPHLRGPTLQQPSPLYETGCPIGHKDEVTILTSHSSPIPLSTCTHTPPTTAHSPLFPPTYFPPTHSKIPPPHPHQGCCQTTTVAPSPP